MNGDAPQRHDEVPAHDPLAVATRSALGLIAFTLPAGSFSWAAVRTRAVRVQRLRITALIGGCVLVFASATAAVAAGSHPDRRADTIAPHETASTAGVVRSTTQSRSTTPASTPSCRFGACPTGASGPPPTSLAPSAPITPPIPVTTATPTSSPPAPAEQSDLQATLTFAAIPLVAERSNGYTLTVRNVSDHAVAFSADWQLGAFVNAPGESGGFPVHEQDVVLAIGEERAFVSEITPAAEMVGTALVSAAVLRANRAPMDRRPIPYDIGPRPWIQIKIVPPNHVEGQPLDPPFGRWAVVMSTGAPSVRVGESMKLHATVRNIGDQVQLTSGYGALAVVCFGQGHGPIVAEWGELIGTATIAPGEQQTFTIQFKPTQGFASVRDEHTTCMVGVTFHDDLGRIRPLQNINPPEEIDSGDVKFRVLPAAVPTTTTTTTTSPT